MERVDLAGSIAQPGSPHGPPGPSAPPPIRDNVVGPALEVPVADDRPNAGSAPALGLQLPPPTAPAQLPGAEHSPYRPGQEAAADPEQALEPVAESAGKHKLPEAERVADARFVGGRGRGAGGRIAPGPGGSGGGRAGQRTREPGARGRSAPLPAQLRAGHGHGTRRQNAAQPRAQWLQTTSNYYHLRLFYPTPNFNIAFQNDFSISCTIKYCDMGTGRFFSRNDLQHSPSVRALTSSFCQKGLAATVS